MHIVSLLMVSCVALCLANDSKSLYVLNINCQKELRITILLVCSIFQQSFHSLFVCIVLLYLQFSYIPPHTFIYEQLASLAYNSPGFLFLNILY